MCLRITKAKFSPHYQKKEKKQANFWIKAYRPVHFNFNSKCLIMFSSEFPVAELQQNKLIFMKLR